MNPMTTTDGQVDQIIGSAYQVIKYVASNMEALISLSESIDPLVDSMQTAFEALRRTYQEAGYQLLKATFKTGAAVGSESHVLMDDTTGIAYSWDGALPKFVPENSSPVLSGGVGPGHWLPRDLTSLRQALASDDGVKLVKGAASIIQVTEVTRRSYVEAGYNIVGTFEDGFVYTSAKDIGISLATGKGYTGQPGYVTGGTDPETGAFLDISDKSLRHQVGHSGSITTNLAELASGIFEVGLVVGIKDRPGAKFEIENSGTPDGYVLLDAGNGKVARLLYSNRLKASWFGAVTNAPGVRETETTLALNAMFALSASHAGLDFELDGRYFTNGEIVWPLCTTKAPFALSGQQFSGHGSLIKNSHTGVSLRIKTGSSIGDRNYATLVENLQLINAGTFLEGAGILIEGAFSPTFRRVIIGNFDVCFKNYCSSEVLFDKCVAYQCNIGIAGDQVSNPFGVDANDYSVVTYNQFVCFGYEKHAIYSNGGGVSIHLGGTIAAPGWAARSAIAYVGSFRSVNIDTVLVENQQLLADGVFSFTGSGLKRSIRISGVTQEVIKANAPSTLIRADDVENILIENCPFSVQGSVVNAIKYVIIDKAKCVTLRNNTPSYTYLNKVDLYDVETVTVDGYNLVGVNPDLTVKKSTGEPLGLFFESSYTSTPVTDDLGRPAVSANIVWENMPAKTAAAFVNRKLPAICVAKVKTSGSTITAIWRDGNNSRGQITSACKPDRWKTHFFAYDISASALPEPTSTLNGPRFSGISAVSKIGMLVNDNTYNPSIATSQAEITAGLIGFGLYRTIYNSSASSADPAGWVNTPGGVKTI